MHTDSRNPQSSDTVAQVFISYSRKDKEFVRQLGDALAAQKREAWVDWKDIPLTAEWQQEIFNNIEAADNFIFVISPESVASANCKREIDHAFANNKRMVPIFHRTVPDEAIPDALGKFQRIDFGDGDRFDARFAALLTALDTDLAWVQAHTRLLTRAKEWEREAKDSSFLLRGKDLREAEQWVAKSAEKEPKPTTLHSQYILASRQLATKTQRIIFEAVAVAFLIAVGLAIYAFRQKNVAERNARESRGRELAASAAGSLSNDPEKSVLLGEQAVNATLSFGEPPVPAAEDVLHQAILSFRLRRTLRGHSESVDSVAYSSDGKRLATASGDGTVKVWDTDTGKEMLTLHAYSAPVHSVAWSPDGKRLATGNDDKRARVWDAATGKELLILRGHNGAVLSVAWSPDGKQLGTASDDRTAKVWDAASGREVRTLRGHSESVYCVAFSPNGERLATTSTDTTAKVWDAATGKELLTLRGHDALVYSVAWNSDGTRLATGSEDKTAKLWDAATGKELLTLPTDNDQVYGVAWSPDGTQLAIAGGNYPTKVWDMDNGQEALTLRGDNGDVLSVAWSPDGTRLVTGSEDKTVKVWDAASGQEALTMRHGGPVLSVAWSPDSKRLVTGSYGTAKVWDAASGQEVLTLSSYSIVAWSSDGRRLATTDGHWVKVWDASSGQESATLDPRLDGYHVNDVSFSSNGKRLAIAGENATAEVWDLISGQLVMTLRGHANSVDGVAFSPEGKRLATVSADDTAKVWDAASGKELLTLTLSGPQGRARVAWSPDGSRLVTTNADNQVKVWDASSGQELLTLRGHSQWVVGVAYSPEGRRLATASEDGTAKVWDAKTGKELLTLRGHSGIVYCVAFSPDGKRLATGGQDGTVQVYAMDIHDLLKLARSRVTRDLTPDECKRYFQSEKCPPLP